MIMGVDDDIDDLGDVGAELDYSDLRNAVRAWNGRTFTAAEVLPVINAALATAQANEYRVKWTGDLPPAMVSGTGLITEASQHVRQLVYLRDLMAKQASNPYRFAHPHKTWTDIRTATLNPIMWQGNAAAVSLVLDNAQLALLPQIIQQIANLPGAVLAAALAAAAKIIEDGLKGAMPDSKIPGWVAPTILGGAGLGLALWVYSTLRGATR